MLQSYNEVMKLRGVSTLHCQQFKYIACLKKKTKLLTTPHCTVRGITYYNRTREDVYFKEALRHTDR